MRRKVGLAALVVLLSSCLFAQMQPQDEMFGYVVSMEGKTRQERGAFIKKQLRTMDVGFFTVPFEYYTYRLQDTLNLSGEDIVARVGEGQMRLVVGAHFDASAGSPGAIDDASGVAVILELIKTMKNYPWNCTVDFVFFDQEENGLLGSQFYISRVLNARTHYGMIDLDMEGLGNEVYVGPVGGGDDDFLMPFVRKAAKATKVACREEEYYPSSDFQAFASMHLENIAISVVPKGDAQLLSRATLAGPDTKLKNQPQILSIIHTPNDRSDKVEPNALTISFNLTSTLLKLINSSIR